MVNRLKQLSFIVAVAVTTPVWANDSMTSWLMAALDRDGAAEIVRNKRAGRILEVKTKEQAGKEVHVIKVLTDDDRVKLYRVDAETGKIIKNR
jgi:uncharacterized membrane protein YkoI